MGLEACGARVVEASNAATARQFVQTQPLNLVVTDLAMPREDGVSLLKWLRARLPDHNGTPAVIAVTAFYVPGYAAYFQKPIKIEDFVATVASVLGRGRGGGAKRVEPARRLACGSPGSLGSRGCRAAEENGAPPRAVPTPSAADRR